MLLSTGSRVVCRVSPSSNSACNRSNNTGIITRGLQAGFMCYRAAASRDSSRFSSSSCRPHTSMSGVGRSLICYAESDAGNSSSSSERTEQAAQQARPEVLPGSQQQQQKQQNEQHQQQEEQQAEQQAAEDNDSHSIINSAADQLEPHSVDHEQQEQQQQQQVVQQQQDVVPQAAKQEFQQEERQQDVELQQQQQQQQLEQQSPRSPEQLQLQYLRHQALKLQALEDYEQLMQQYPSTSSTTSSTTSSKQRSTTSAAAATAANEQETQQQESPAQPPDVPVLDAVLLIAKHAHPELDAAVVKQQLDDLAAEVEAGLPAGVRYPLRVIREINKVLFEVHGFSGNTEDYYHPDNSCINRVLETKRGIPISLSIVYMEVAARLGLKMAGVNLPAHFMIRPQVEGMELMVDAFNGGELTALQDAEEVLGKLMGYQVKLDPRFVRGDTPYFSSRQLMLRLLNNLRQIYLTLNMAEEALCIVRYMRATAPAGMLPELQRDEGLCLYGLGRLAEAAEVLGDYLQQGAPSGDAAVVTAVLEKIRERAAEAAAAAAVAAATSGSSSSVEEDGDAGSPGSKAG